MKNRLITPRVLFITAAVFTAAFMRLLPHWPNFTPVAAIALFSGAYMTKKYLAFLVPALAMLLSDLVLGFHSTMIAVYSGFALTVLIGISLRSRLRPASVILAAVASSVLFFMITNFGSWLSGMMPYPMNFNGLMQAYIAGIPFFNNGLLGDLTYTFILFGGYYLVSNRYPVLAKS